MLGCVNVKFLLLAVAKRNNAQELHESHASVEDAILTQLCKIKRIYLCRWNDNDQPQSLLPFPLFTHPSGATTAAAATGRVSSSLAVAARREPRSLGGQLTNHVHQANHCTGGADAVVATIGKLLFWW